MSRSFVEPDWIRFFDPKADWRDSLQHFNLHRSLYRRQMGVDITQMVHEGRKEKTFPMWESPSADFFVTPNHGRKKTAG
ncbi:hypothetical protein RBB77_19295 [Tunturibacter psychrotolerans]|uniref:Uncharacterized protein n=1 Tax=Tunturiibacter psychrotolerans TaxID=3069686 RepID=A0AAU7ZNP2_9BACT